MSAGGQINNSGLTSTVTLPAGRLTAKTPTPCVLMPRIRKECVKNRGEPGGGDGGRH